MAKYISMVANGGNKIDVSIVKTIQNADGTEVSKDEIRKFVNEKLGISNDDQNEKINLNSKYVNAVKEGMRSVTSGEAGTAYARFKNFNIAVGGKTGSAEAVRNIMAEYFGMNTQDVTEDMQANAYTESMR